MWTTGYEYARFRYADRPGRVIDPTTDKFVSPIVCAAHAVLCGDPNQLIENGAACQS